MSSERPIGRFESLGGNSVYRQEDRSVEEDLKTVQSLTTGDISKLLTSYPLGQLTTVTVGPLTSLNGHSGNGSR